MQIIGIDRLVFAVDDLASTRKFLTDFGLVVSTVNGISRFSALDGTSIDLVSEDDPANPDTLTTGNRLRRIVYGVADDKALDAVAVELAKDRDIVRKADGSFDTVDDLGFALSFQRTCRRPLDLPVELVNIPGARPQRPVNCLGVQPEFTPQPRSLSHVALFVPDIAKAEAFYIGRLGFRCNDRLGGGPFLCPAGSREHHTMFLIKTPPHIKGCEHIAFHLGGVGEVMRAGTRFTKLGYRSFWGPGRHIMGSNWFWYFSSPLGCNLEYDADMDLHDDSWVPREMPLHVDNAQAYLLQPRDNWAPFAGPPKGAGAN